MDKQKLPSLSLLSDDLIHHLAQGLNIVGFGNDAAKPIALYSAMIGSLEQPLETATWAAGSMGRSFFNRFSTTQALCYCQVHENGAEGVGNGLPLLGGTAQFFLRATMHDRLFLEGGHLCPQ